jgi:hypothetical protein
VVAAEQIRKPVPGKDTFNGDNNICHVGFNDFKEQLQVCPHVFMDFNFAHSEEDRNTYCLINKCYRRIEVVKER